MALIIIGTDKRCTCDCGTPCINNSSWGSRLRCTKEQLEEKGHTTIELNSKKDDAVIQKIIRNDGKDKRIKITLICKNKKESWEGVKLFKSLWSIWFAFSFILMASFMLYEYFKSPHNAVIPAFLYYSAVINIISCMAVKSYQKHYKLYH